MFTGFKISIHVKNIPMKRVLKEEFEIYGKSFNEIIPFPRYLIKKKLHKTLDQTVDLIIHDSGRIHLFTYLPFMGIMYKIQWLLSNKSQSRCAVPAHSIVSDPT